MPDAKATAIALALNGDGGEGGAVGGDAAGVALDLRFGDVASGAATDLWVVGFSEARGGGGAEDVSLFAAPLLNAASLLLGMLLWPATLPLEWDWGLCRWFSLALSLNDLSLSAMLGLTLRGCWSCPADSPLLSTAVPAFPALPALPASAGDSPADLPSFFQFAILSASGLDDRRLGPFGSVRE